MTALLRYDPTAARKLIPEAQWEGLRPRLEAARREVLDDVVLLHSGLPVAADSIDAVLLCPRCCDPLYRRSVKVSILARTNAVARTGAPFSATAAAATRTDGGNTRFDNRGVIRPTTASGTGPRSRATHSRKTRCPTGPDSTNRSARAATSLSGRRNPTGRNKLCMAQPCALRSRTTLPGRETSRRH